MKAQSNESNEAQISLRRINLPKWSIIEETGYQPQTTFWQDFSIADLFGMEAVADTFKQAFDGWKYNITYMAELALVLNHKGWEYYYAAEKHGNSKELNALAELYFELYREVDNYCRGENDFTEEERKYYWWVLD